MRGPALRSALFVAAFASAIAAEPAFASPIEEARELVYRGDDLCLDGRYDEALHTYRLAQGLVDAPTTRIEVAKTLFALGRWLEAYEIASSIDTPPDEDDPNPFRMARTRAHALREQIDARIPTIRVTSSRAPLPTSTPVRLTRNGVASGDDEVEREGTIGESIRVDPGTYVVEVKDGSARPAMRVTVREGESRTVTVEASEVQVRSRFSPIAAVALGVAGGGLVVGAVAGGVYLDARSDLEDLCKTSVFACRGRERDRVDAIGWVANTGFIVFGAAGAVGLVTALVDRTETSPKEAKAAPEPTARLDVSPAYVGLSGTF